MSTDTEQPSVRAVRTESGSGDGSPLVATLRRPSRPVIIAAVLVALLLAGGIAINRGVMPWQDGGDGAADRAAALTAARTAATTLTTLDAAAPEESVAAWAEVTTGELAEAVGAGEADFQKLITSGGFDTSSTIQEAAVATFDGDAGVAEVLVAIDVQLTPQRGQGTTERLSLAVTVEEVDDSWKASALAPLGSGDTVGGGSDALSADIATDVASAMVSLWSYDHRRLAGVESLAPITTPDFLDEYAATYQEIERLAPQAKAVVKARVTGIATIAEDGDRATVLVFLTQRARKGGGKATTADTRLRVAVEKVDGQWRVDGVTPL
ncbi:hypothetical protein ACFQ0K_09405 [Nocardioides caeni]|uniref:Uncharacterized protein n=1 Tax=Nocardioides caeni TaxID=574700 RepID=A0A4S8N0Z5_9ACTN|nr:hypothetical protein [Nocardioides caeni]THV09131.1 hypothetical protein E9934_16995 [Nocardioides caeni]